MADRGADERPQPERGAQAPSESERGWGPASREERPRPGVDTPIRPGRADTSVRPYSSIGLRCLLALFPLWCTAGVVVLWTPWRQKLIVGSVAALTLVSPAHGLLALAVLAPLGAVIESVTALPYRLSEAFVMAFLGAWLLRAGGDRRGPRVPPVMAAAGWLLGLAALASVGVVAWRVRAYPDQLAYMPRWLLQAYYVFIDGVGFVDAARLVEGLALVAATVYLFRHRPSLAVSLPSALCVAGTLAALASLLISRGIGPAELVDKFTRLGYRSGHIADPNAAGSYFAMTLCLALGMALRARGTARAAWAALAAANGIGLWLSESRSAMVAAAIVAAAGAGWLFTARWTLRLRLAAVAALLVVGITGTAIGAYRLQRDPTFRGGGFREQFNQTSLRMIAARPLAGIGVGQYHKMSALWLTPQMAWTYGHENAHNYFLQVGAELGVPGLLLFVYWINAALVGAGRAAARRADPRLLGAAGGALVFLATCLTGHPLLVSEAAFPFWMQFGLALGLAGSALMPASEGAASGPPRRARVAAGLVAAAIITSAAIGAARAPLEPPASRAVNGFYGWEIAQDGRRAHWTEQYASLFVPSDVTRVAIPVRMPSAVRAISPMGVEVGTGGVPQRRALVGPEWVTLEVALGDADPPARFKRIDLKVDRTWQPAVYIAGSADMRSVGVQVGECRLFR